jgi:hypothetical protein
MEESGRKKVIRKKLFPVGFQWNFPASISSSSSSSSSGCSVGNDSTGSSSSVNSSNIGGSSSNSSGSSSRVAVILVLVEVVVVVTVVAAAELIVVFTSFRTADTPYASQYNGIIHILNILIVYMFTVFPTQPFVSSVLITCQF